MTRLISFYVLVGVILVVGFLFYRVMATFLLPLFLAALLVVIFRPLHVWISHRCKERRQMSALLTTIAIVLIVLIPLSWMITVAGMELGSLATRFDTAEIKRKLGETREKAGLKLPAPDELRAIENVLSTQRDHILEGETVETPPAGVQALLDRTANIETALEDEEPKSSATVDDLRAALLKLQAAAPGSLEYSTAVFSSLEELQQFKRQYTGGPLRAYFADLANPGETELQNYQRTAVKWGQDLLVASTAEVGKYLVILGITIVALYFFFADGPAMMATVMRLSPMDDRHEMELAQEFENISRAVVVATLLAAFVQGLLGGIGFYFAGVESVLLLMMLTMALAMIPFVGAAAVWVPVAAWLAFYEDRMWAGILLALWGGIVVSNADNVIKPMVLKNKSKLHPLLALLSVLGGVQSLGPIGIFIGPMVVVFLQSLLNILHHELTAMDDDNNSENESTEQSEETVNSSDEQPTDEEPSNDNSNDTSNEEP